MKRIIAEVLLGSLLLAMVTGVLITATTNTWIGATLWVCAFLLAQSTWAAICIKRLERS